MKIASFKYIFTMFLCCFLLVSCGGGSGSNSNETKITPFTFTLDIKKGTSDSPAYVSVQKNEEGWVRLMGERTISINKATDKIRTISFCNEKRPVEVTEDGETKTVDKYVKKMKVEEYSAIVLSLLKNKGIVACDGSTSSSSQDKQVKLLISSKNDGIRLDKVDVIGRSSYRGNEDEKLSIQLPNTDPISLAVIGKQTDSNSNTIAYYFYGKNNYKFSDGDELSIDFKNEGEVLEKFTPNVLDGQKYTLAYDLNNSPATDGYLSLSDDNTQEYWRFSSVSSKFSYSESWIKKISKDSGVLFKKSSNTITDVHPDLASDINGNGRVSLILPGSSKKNVSFSKTSLFEANLSMMFVRFKHHEYWLDVMNSNTAELDIAYFITSAKGFTDLPEPFKALDDITKSQNFEFLNSQMKANTDAKKFTHSYSYFTKVAQ